MTWLDHYNNIIVNITNQLKYVNNYCINEWVWSLRSNSSGSMTTIIKLDYSQ